jgi:hypothetical protein
MAPGPAATLAALRAWARDPHAVVGTVCGARGPVAILPADVVGKTDDQLRARLAQSRDKKG